MNVAGIILAAGESRRMGYPKALLKVNGETFVDRLVRLFLNWCSPVVVVLGAHAEQIRAGTQPAAAQIVVNSRYREGQITSLQCGLTALQGSLSGVLFTLVDHPNVAPDTIAALVSDARPLLRVPRYEGRRGHPIFFAAQLTAEFLALPPTSSAREVVARHEAAIEYIDVDDPGVLQDIDDPEIYRRLIGADPGEATP